MSPWKRCQIPSGWRRPAYGSSMRAEGQLGVELGSRDFQLYGPTSITPMQLDYITRETWTTLQCCQSLSSWTHNNVLISLEEAEVSKREESKGTTTKEVRFITSNFVVFQDPSEQHFFIVLSQMTKWGRGKKKKKQVCSLLWKVSSLLLTCRAVSRWPSKGLAKFPLVADAFPRKEIEEMVRKTSRRLQTQNVIL